VPEIITEMTIPEISDHLCCPEGHLTAANLWLVSDNSPSLI